MAECGKHDPAAFSHGEAFDFPAVLHSNMSYRAVDLFNICDAKFATGLNSLSTFQWQLDKGVITSVHVRRGPMQHKYHA